METIKNDFISANEKHDQAANVTENMALYAT